MLRNILLFSLIEILLAVDVTNIVKNIQSEKEDSKYSKIKEIVAEKISSNGYNIAFFILSMAIVKGREYLIHQNDKMFQRNWEEEINKIFKNKAIKIEKIFKEIELLDETINKEEKDTLSSVLKDEKDNIILEYIINYTSSNIIEENLKNITRLNILILGLSQIGKTTLINEILFLDEKKKGKVGDDAKSTTMEDTPFISDVLKHIRIIDSRGIEIGENNLGVWFNHYKTLMEENTKKGNLNDLIHCIWYCVSGNVINDPELENIKKINTLFNKYKVPIIFVYLKPFFSNDIEKIKSRTSTINNNFIAVQSIHYKQKCKENEEFCFNENQEYKPKNMDKLLYMTKDLALDGIINSISSRTIYNITEEIAKLIKRRFNQKYEEFVEIINGIEIELKQTESPDIISKNIDNAKEKMINKIFEMIEEALFKSQKNISNKTKNLIRQIQKKIEDKYNKKFEELYKNTLDETIEEIKQKKNETYIEQQEKTFLGCSELNEKDLDKDLKNFNNKFEDSYLIQLYSMKKSFETINEKIIEQILDILISGIDEIIKDKNLYEELEKKINTTCRKEGDKLINILDEEIKLAFKKKTFFGWFKELFTN